MSSATPEKRLALICPECEAPSSTYVRGTMWQQAEPDSGWPFPTLLSLVHCEHNHCGEPSLVMQQDLDALGLDDPYVLWPSKERSLSLAIPEKLRAEHAEARTCFKAKAYTATAVMVRRTLEGFCADQGCTKRTLHESLRALHDSGVIDARLLEWAQGLRSLGNAGAHFGTAIQPQDARDALELGEALLDYVYVFSKKYAEFQARRASSTAANSSTP
ncbi:DUF4145 domain-containing protein [Dactylosporangium cerinum]|uniref:DUF4145 domain-containing protein n=1 Tax=Dactylosporangium cerinum TaxID=1434730 RepID=A0ABV9VQI9_9ACTN